MNKLLKFLRQIFGTRVKFKNVSTNKIESGILITYTSVSIARPNHNYDIVHYAVIETRNEGKHMFLPVNQIMIGI